MDVTKLKKIGSGVMAIIAASLLVLSLVGCGGSSEESASSGSGQTSQSSTSGENRTQYPLTITYYGLDGEETVTFDKAPERTLVVGQGNIETMLALGLGDRIVAVAADSDMPDEYEADAAKLNNLNVYCPDKETILSTDPDFIYAPKWLFMMNQMGLDEWFDRGVNVYINSNWNNDMDAPRTIDNELNDILVIGQIYDVQDEAEALVADLRAQVDDIEAKAKATGESPRTMILFPDSDQLFANYSTTDLAGTMVLDLGGTIAVPDSTSVGKEEIVNADPDVIVVMYSTSYSQADNEKAAADAVAYFDDPAYANVKAVREGHVYAVEEGLLNIPGAGVARGLEELASCMYPDVDF